MFNPLLHIWYCVADPDALFDSSANPCALLSSRLSLYLKRPWTALAPCPLAKELIPVHPRKVFFYLTTSPYQSLPANSDDIISPTAHVKRLTPSVSDPSSDQDDIDVEFDDHARMSPSPEVDLGSHALEDDLPMGPPTPSDSFSGRSSLTRDGKVDHRMSQNRAPSPPLEADEKGFTETATAVRARGMSLHEPVVEVSIEVSENQNRSEDPVEETAEVTQRKDQELGYELFGHAHGVLSTSTQRMIESSPMIQPRHLHIMETVMKKIEPPQHDVEMAEGPWDMDSPEDVELDELDGLFSGY